MIFINQKYVQHSQAVAQKCSVKKLFLKISQKLQENTYAKVEKRD